MIPIYKFTTKFLKLFIQLLFLAQIVLMILVLATASFWFFDLIGMNFLQFLYPLTDAITKLMHTFYHQQVQIGGQFFDGSLLLFDLIAIALIFGFNKIKYYVNIGIDNIEDKIRNRQNYLEEIFNKNLQKETEQRLAKLKNLAVLVEFEMRNCTVSDFWGGDKTAGVKEKTDEAFKELQMAMRAIPQCKMAKTDNKMLILSDNFDDVEKILDTINNTVSILRTKYRKKRWLLNFYAATDIYGNNINVKEVYPILQNLIDLKIQDEVLCLGNFNIRYGMLNIQNYEVSKKGHYTLKGTDDSSVWTIIKKF